MLIPHSLTLARARRHKKVVPTFMVSVPEVAAGIIQAIEAEECPAIIGIDTRQKSVLGLENLFASVLALITNSSAAISLVVEVKMEREEIEKWLTLGAPTLHFYDAEQRSRKSVYEITQVAVKRAIKHNAEIVGVVSGLVTPNRLLEFVEETGVLVLSMPVGVMQNERPIVSLPYIQQVAKESKLPLIAQEFPLSPPMRQKCAAAGITSFIVRHELEEAYTAGVRTAMRDRSLTDPYTYQAAALKAVKQTARHYLIHI